jgi:hypothetical protein
MEMNQLQSPLPLWSLYPWKKIPHSPFDREAGWAPETSLDIVEKREIYCHCRESNPNYSSTQPVAHHYSDSYIDQNNI